MLFEDLSLLSIDVYLENKNQRSLLLLELDTQIFLHPWTLKNWQDEIKFSYNHTFLLIKNDLDIEKKKVIGFVSFSILADVESELKKIGILPKYQNQKYGKYLLTEFIKLLKLKKVETIFLEVSEENLVAQKLYEKNGFQKIRSISNYYKNKTAIVYKKDIR